MVGSHSHVVRERRPFLIIATVLVVAVSFLQWIWLTVGVGIVALLVFWFFRDPERVPPQGEHVLVSPADGRIVEIVRAKEEEFLKEETLRVSVFLNIFNVHVNRIPFSGKILDIVYRSGKFHFANNKDASSQNERNAVLLHSPSGEKIVFVQIAGFIARRIICWLQAGEEVAKGIRFGMIRFGSRMDIYLPLSTQIKVRVGDQVKGGETVLGELP